MALLDFVMEAVTSNLFDFDNVKLSTFLKDMLNFSSGNERHDIVEKLLYSDWFDIEPKYMTSWISSTLDVNTLRNHDAIIRKIALRMTGISSTSTNYYVDVTHNLIISGIKYDEFRVNAFLMEKELVTQIKYIWSRYSHANFNGKIVLDEDNKRVSMSFTLLLP